eukprot:4687674-Prorocentrum_lima.AAC.1
MTSSLVGSEMCIRDSSRRLRHPQIVRDAGDKQVTRLVCDIGSAVVINDCLLYTSDAADDM